MVGSFYDPNLDEGCAFEELISFHGGLGGPQTAAFILHPAALDLPDEPLVGAAHVNEVLRGWRARLNGHVAAEQGEYHLEPRQFQLDPQSATEGEALT
jgi:hypothetical protein